MSTHDTKHITYENAVYQTKQNKTKQNTVALPFQGSNQVQNPLSFVVKRARRFLWDLVLLETLGTYVLPAVRGRPARASEGFDGAVAARRGAQPPSTPPAPRAPPAAVARRR